MMLGRMLLPRSAAFDPYFNNVSLLLHGDGANGSTTFLDSSKNNKTVTRGGLTTISTLRSVFGGSSILFNRNTKDYLLVPNNTDFNFTDQPFTVEWQMYFTGPMTGFGGHLIDFRGSVNGSLVFYVINGNLYWVDDNLSGDNNTGLPISFNAFAYYAVVRDSSSLKFYKNGALISTFAYSKTLPSGNGLTIGARYNIESNVSSYADGNIDELRITKGIARDVSIVPTTSFPES